MKTDKPSLRQKITPLRVLTTVVILALLGTSAYFFAQYRDIRNNPQKVQQEEAETLLSKVGKLYKLPDETPTIADVQDKEKLKDQPFFANVENGDKLLMFTTAKQAIIYREKENRIINVGPIAIDNSAAADKPKEEEKQQ